MVVGTEIKCIVKVNNEVWLEQLGDGQSTHSLGAQEELQRWQGRAGCVECVDCEMSVSHLNGDVRLNVFKFQDRVID